MISELFDMFNRLHTGNSDDDRKDFKILVKIMLTSFGSDMYTYMLMLEHNDRKLEHAMIKDHREKIFAIRDFYDRSQFTEKQVVEDLTPVLTKIIVQVEMLRTIEGRQWEAGLFQSLTNDMTNFLFYMKNIDSFKMPQRVFP